MLILTAPSTEEALSPMSSMDVNFMMKLTQPDASLMP